jgi:hypothetical protein
MTRLTRMLVVVALGFVVFTIDGLWSAIDPQHQQLRFEPIATAQAQTVCPVPSVEKLSGNWKVESAGCDGDCKDAHVAQGDQFVFTRDVAPQAAFALSINPASSARRASKTEGAALASDGVGNVTGPIVFGHSTLDGSPLQLHWLIVKLRSYEVNGECSLRGRVEVCDYEPAKGASSCNSKQHNGVIHLVGG